MARWSRAMSEAEPLPQYADRELKVLEVLVAVNHRVTERVLPFRIGVQPDGRLAVTIHAQLAMRRVEFATTSSQEPARAIAKLELDANYFWEPEDTHWRALSAALRLAPAALKQALYRSQES